MNRRKDIPPLYQAQDIHACLAALAVGDTVPDQVYISDYASGLIPPWQVAEREESGILTVLTLIDTNTEQLEVFNQVASYVGHDVFVAPERVLSGPRYMYFVGCIHARHKLCDIRQEARRQAERAAGVRKGTFEPSHSGTLWDETEESEDMTHETT